MGSVRATDERSGLSSVTGTASWHSTAAGGRGRGPTRLRPSAVNDVNGAVCRPSPSPLVPLHLLLEIDATGQPFGHHRWAMESCLSCNTSRCRHHVIQAWMRSNYRSTLSLQITPTGPSEWSFCVADVGRPASQCALDGGGNEASAMMYIYTTDRQTERERERESCSDWLCYRRWSSTFCVRAALTRLPVHVSVGAPLALSQFVAPV